MSDIGIKDIGIKGIGIKGIGTKDVGKNIVDKVKDLEELVDIHDAIKQHPYRKEFSKEYMSSYYKLLTKLKEKFWDYIKITKYYTDYTSLPEFYHDFGWSSRALYYDKIPPEAIQHQELCISAIHHFLETGKFDEYYTYYGGCNILPHGARQRKYVWNEVKKQHLPVYKKSEILAMIKDIRDHLKDKGFQKFGMYSEEMVDYLTSKFNDAED